jgi:double-strand break repair protein MRE11
MLDDDEVEEADEESPPKPASRSTRAPTTEKTKGPAVATSKPQSAPAIKRPPPRSAATKQAKITTSLLSQTQTQRGGRRTAALQDLVRLPIIISLHNKFVMLTRRRHQSEDEISDDDDAFEPPPPLTARGPRRRGLASRST